MKTLCITRSIDYVEEESFDAFVGSLTTIYKEAEEEVLFEHGTVTRISLEKEYGYDSDIQIQLKITYSREENPRERSVREEKEKAILDKKRKMYEELKKEFGDK